MGKKPADGDRKYIPRSLRFCRGSEAFEVIWAKARVVYSLPMAYIGHREEIEVKLRVLNVAALRRRLRQLRAREISPRTHESNTLYDTPKKDLRRRGQLIRIRIEQQASHFAKVRPNENAAAVLTYKGPSRSSRGA